MVLRRKYIAVLLVFAAILGVSIFYCCQKSGMFLDEIYSYGLSNSEFAPFLTDVKDGDIVNKTFTREELLDYVTVGDGDAFDYASVYYNQSRDVHPPLYYWLLHTVCSLTPGVYSKWTGLAVNLVFWMGTLILLYATAKRLMNGRAALLATALYGFSTVGLSTMLMIRMYMMLTFWTVLLTYCIVRMMRNERWYWYALLAFTIYAGLMTQYYFVFYAFFLCAAVDGYFLLKKRWKSFGIFSACALSGVLAMYLSFPHCIEHLTGRGMVGSEDHAGLFKSIFLMIRQVVLNAKFGVLVAAAAMVVLLILLIKRKLRIKACDTNTIILFMAGAGVLACLVIASISLYHAVRYIYHLFPLFFLVLSWLLQLISESCEWKKQIVTSAAAVLIGLSGVVSLLSSPAYRYLEHAQFNEMIASHQSGACLYLTDNKNPAITSDFNQLLYFENFFVSDGKTMTKEFSSYLSARGGSEIVVFVSTYKYDADAALSFLLQNVPGGNAELLYQNGYSQVYLVRTEVR